ncbi:tetratricopeptide repeat protein [Rhodopila sp.]|uniref:tetratricopeptide repeat protein n=1 Tax=Rhodopila sp. TaxID=2480087 RepID=UPI002C1F20D2|nr:tetratricopeptide repeat protein [Rhodopila sp.]HVZ08554.1 tetratricopeptide repeat protein [Rhodopila sp.]
MTSLLTRWRDWRERRAGLRELYGLRAEERERERFRVKDVLADAVSAIKRDDLQHAEDMWIKAISLSKQDAETSPWALPILLGLKRFDEAEELMKRLQARRPSNSEYALGLVKVAQAKGDHEAAAQFAVQVRKRFPRVMEGYTLGLSSLRDSKRFQEAELLAQEAMERFPNQVEMFMEHARLASDQTDWAAARERWNTVLTRFDHASGYIGVGHVLIELKQFEEADELLAAGRVRYPLEVSMVIEYAHSAEQRGDTAEAKARWRRVIDRFPTHVIGVTAAAAALERLGDSDQAEQVLLETVERIRHVPTPLIRLGEVQLRRHDFSAASETFSKLRERFPGEAIGYRRGAEAMDGLGRSDEAKALRTMHPSAEH